jgi:drug/metabolite transporter (DMT)-like permease
MSLAATTPRCTGGVVGSHAVPIALAYALCALIWGTTWYAIRVCIGPGGYPTLTALALRFALATIVLLPLARRARPRPSRRALGYLVLSGVLDALAYVLVYLGEERVAGGVAAVLYGTQPLILAILLTVSRIERITRRDVVGAVVALGGVAVLFVDQLDVSARQGIGVALVLGSVLASTIYAVIMKRHAAEVSSVLATTIFLAVTAIVVVPVALIAGQGVPWPPPAGPTWALLYLAVVGSVIAFLAYFWLIGKTTLVIASSLVFVYPLVALITDAVFERELVLGARAYVGAGVTLAGLGVTLVRGQVGRTGG